MGDPQRHPRSLPALRLLHRLLATPPPHRKTVMASTSALGLALPIAEWGEKGALVLFGDLLFLHHPGYPDRFAHLLEIGRASVAEGEMLVDAAAIVAR